MMSAPPCILVLSPLESNLVQGVPGEAWAKTGLDKPHVDSPGPARFTDLAQIVLYVQQTRPHLLCLDAEAPLLGHQPHEYAGLDLAVTLARDPRLSTRILLLSFDGETELHRAHPLARVLLREPTLVRLQALPAPHLHLAQACKELLSAPTDEEIRRDLAWEILQQRVETVGKELRHDTPDVQARPAVRLLLGAMEVGHVTPARGERALRNIWSTWSNQSISEDKLRHYLDLVQELQDLEPFKRLTRTTDRACEEHPPHFEIGFLDQDSQGSGWLECVTTIFEGRVESLPCDAQELVGSDSVHDRDVVLLDLFHLGRPEGPGAANQPWTGSGSQPRSGQDLAGELEGASGLDPELSVLNFIQDSGDYNAYTLAYEYV